MLNIVQARSIMVEFIGIATNLQAQVLSDGAAQKKLGKVIHKKELDVPVMFFGTLEIAWLAGVDVVSFAEGIAKGFLNKAKHKSFQKAVAQVIHRAFPCCLFK